MNHHFLYPANNIFDFLPFGEEMAAQHSQTADFETRYKFNDYGGKKIKYLFVERIQRSCELDQETGLYYYGARYYDPETSIFLSVDPLAEKYPGMNPYTYTFSNPVRFMDPTGMEGETWDDDYKINKKTGEITLIKKTKDNFDRLLQTDKNGNVKYYKRKSKKGQAKVAIDNIAKGILKNGMNMKKRNTRIRYGKTNQPSYESVRYFLVMFSNHIGKEIAGFGGEIANQKYFHIYKYQKNTKTTSFSWMAKSEFVRAYGWKFHFHTHPYGDKTPSQQDKNTYIRNYENGFRGDAYIYYNLGNNSYQRKYTDETID